MNLSDRPLRPPSIPHRALRLFMVALLLNVEAWAAFATVTTTQEPLKILVEPTETQQAMTGFGSGSVFYSNHLLNGVPSKQRQEVYDWLWSDVEENMFMFQTRNDLEKTNDNDDPFELDRSKLDYGYVDKLAELLLEAQKRRGADQIVFIATLYSSPKWLKDNGKTKGGGFDTSSDVNYLEMAEFVYAFLERLKTEHGIDTRFLTIANEPDWNHKQPGTKWKPDDLAKATALSVDHLRALVEKTPGMVMPKIIAANTLSVRSAGRFVQAIMDSPHESARKNTDVIGFHLYDSKTKPKHYTRLREFGLPMWMTEWTGPRGMPKGTKNPVSHSLGQMVGRIRALHGGASVIMHFEFGHPNHYSAGVFLANWKKPWVRDTPYWVWQQMCNRTPTGDGAFLVKTQVGKEDGEWSDRVAAFTDTASGQTTVHLINPLKESVKAVEIDFSGQKIASAKTFRTSREENHKALGTDATTIEGDHLTIDLPAESFVTLQVSHR